MSFVERSTSATLDGSSLGPTLSRSAKDLVKQSAETECEHPSLMDQVLVPSIFSFSSNFVQIRQRLCETESDGSRLDTAHLQLSHWNKGCSQSLMNILIF